MVVAAPRAQVAPAPLPGQWSFYADRIVPAWYAPPSAVTDLGPVIVTSFSYSQTLSNWGTGEATILVQESGLSRADLTALWSWRLWAFYDGLPVWCGLPTGCVDNGSAVVSLTFIELPGFLTRRAYGVVDGQRFDQVEQTDIAWQLCWPVLEVGVQVIREPRVRFYRDRSYQFLEGGSRAELLSNLSNVISGPEFRTEYATRWDGRPVCVLRIAYPTVGRGHLGVTVPGGVLDYNATWAADNIRTQTYAVGDLPEDATEDARQPVAIETRRPYTAGVPLRMDAIDQWGGTILMTTLAERARTNAQLYAKPSLELTCTVPVSAPPITTYGVGDPTTVHITDELAESGIEVSARLTALQVSADNGTAQWTVDTPAPKTEEETGGRAGLARAAEDEGFDELPGFDEPPGSGRETLIHTLGRLTRLSNAMFRRRLGRPVQGETDPGGPPP